MKTAIYIEDGVVQLVITPESEFEKNALKSFDNKPFEAEIYNGTFYDCLGGWTRQKEQFPNTFGNHESDKSLILRVTNPKPNGVTA